MTAPPDAGGGAPEDVEVRGSSLTPLIRPGTGLWLLRGYYETHPVGRGELVAFVPYKGSPVLSKVAYAVAGDRWELKEASGGFRIIINGRAVRNSEGKEFRIPVSSAGRLALYAKDYPTLPEDSLLIFGDDPGGSRDSAAFGLVNRRDLAGRLVLPSAK